MRVGGRESHLPLVVDRSDGDLGDLVTGDSAVTGASCVQGFAVSAAVGQVTSASLASALRKSVTTAPGENNSSGRSFKSRFFSLWLPLVQAAAAVVSLRVAWLPV